MGRWREMDGGVARAKGSREQRLLTFAGRGSTSIGDASRRSLNANFTCIEEKGSRGTGGSAGSDARHVAF